MSFLRTGVIGSSLMEHERRVPIHPRHLSRIPAQVRRELVIESGYGRGFAVGDEHLATLCGALASREELLRGCELVILPKPVPADLSQVREGGILWGWFHCVQQSEVTQLAIDRRLTLIAFEAMFQWQEDGRRDLHSFHRNNELAGHCAVHHALQLSGFDGHYGPSRKAVVLSFGAVGRGAVHALLGRGFHDLTVFTRRPPHLVRARIPGCRHRRMRRGKPGEPPAMALVADGSRRPLIEELEEADLIVNGILQDPNHPFMYFAHDDVGRLKPGCLIVDVSCDRGMGFPFARPTSFAEPTFRIGDAVCYAVDHTPSYLWDSASWEISEALLPYLATVMEGPQSWQRSPTIRRALEIRKGEIRNPDLLSFQNREADYPHALKARR
ncbi:MAG: hypothetical protein GY856_10415 [bacterium]|nr:hypothetical protein [bacterium]